MPPKIFITGVTGYIAGEILYQLSHTHPDYEIAALIRSEEKASLVTRAYPSLRPVIGGLDDAEILKKEAGIADVVIHAADASDHVSAAESIIAGLHAGHSKEKPGFLLHTGGTGILCWEDARGGCKGEWSEHQYNDWEKVDELKNLPDDAFHRNVDKIVLGAGEKYEGVVRIALICPPTIYGAGRGPISSRSRQVYEMTKHILTTKTIPIIGAGRARWNNVHVADLASLYLLLTNAALKNNPEPELWTPKAYYFAENGEHLWSDVARLIGKTAEKKGLVENLKVKELGREQALEAAGFEAESWGFNSRGKAERARKLLGWNPRAPSLEETVPEIVRGEWELLKGKK